MIFNVLLKLIYYTCLSQPTTFRTPVDIWLVLESSTAVAVEESTNSSHFDLRLDLVAMLLDKLTSLVRLTTKLIC